jgi:hypothetical protein
MRHFILYLLVTTLTWGSIYAQEEPSGFLGSKNLISINASGSFRILHLLGPQTTASRDVFDEKTNTFDFEENLFRSSINASFLRITKRNKGFGLMYNYETFRVNYTNEYISNFYDFNDQTLSINRVESPEFISHAIKANHVWTAKTSFLPVGFRGILGLGPRFVSLNTNRDYYAAATVPEPGTNFTSSEIHKISEMPEDVKVSFSAIELSYNGIIAYPVTKNLMVEFGFAFRTAYTLSYENNLSANIDYYSNKDIDTYEEFIDKKFYTFDYTDMVKKENWRNVFSMNLGLSFAF